MNTEAKGARLLGRLALVGLCGLVLAGAAGSDAPLDQEITASERAQQIYEQLRRRTPPSDWSGATASAFPEVSEGVVRPLERLAASRDKVEEAEAMGDLAEALEGTGYYSKVSFKSIPGGAKIKYRPIARDRVVTAQAGWNYIAIGFYYVWVDRGGTATPAPDQFDIIAKRVKIVIREAKPRRH